MCQTSVICNDYHFKVKVVPLEIDICPKTGSVKNASENYVTLHNKTLLFINN